MSDQRLSIAFFKGGQKLSGSQGGIQLMDRGGPGNDRAIFIVTYGGMDQKYMVSVIIERDGVILRNTIAIKSQFYTVGISF